MRSIVAEPVNPPPIPKFRKGERAMLKRGAGRFWRIVGTDFDTSNDVWWYLLVRPDNSYAMWMGEDDLEKPVAEQVIERWRRGEI